MPRYFVLIFAFMVFGCTSTKVKEELVRVEELMSNHPDSAFTIIKSINPDDIRGRADRAFYALLYTQAQYKNYEQIQSDSLIDVAVDYYENKPIKDRLTRAYMYKAAALSDMERHKEAIEWLKKAEKVASMSDYLILGLINYQIGALYQTNFVANNEHIVRYKIALKNYRLAGHKRFENNTLSRIGQLYIRRDIDSAFKYLKQGIELSKEISDSIFLFENISLLATAFNQNKNYNYGKELSLSVVNNHSNIKINNRVYYQLASSYARLNNIDSAIYYLNRISLPKKKSDSLGLYLTLIDIAEAKRDYKMVYDYHLKATEINDSIIMESRKNDLYAAEKQFDHTILQQRARQLEINRNYLVLIFVLTIIIIGGTIIVIFVRKKRVFKEKTRLVEQLQMDLRLQHIQFEEFVHENKTNIASINQTLKERSAIEQSLKEIVDDRMRIFRQLMTVKYEFGSNPETFIKKFDEIISINKKSTEDSDKIIKIANQRNDNIIDYICSENPNIKYNDKLLLSLICLQFTPVEMSVFLNSPTIDATYSAKYRLIKKLKISTLEDYIVGIQSERANHL